MHGDSFLSCISNKIEYYDSSDEDDVSSQNSVDRNEGVMKIYLDPETNKIEAQSEWISDVVLDGVYMMLPAGNHIYLLSHL